MHPIAPSEPQRILSIYTASLAAAGGATDPAFVRLVDSHMADLVALTRIEQHNAADVARQRGPRAARLDAVLAAINAGFADAEFSLHHVAGKERLSERSLRALLKDSGKSFADRVLALRLEKAQRLLADPRHAQRKVIDIALSCGFNDVSYFHRSFRTRFGMTPNEARAAARAAEHSIAA
jgi:transcriptional regulator GlxA family with amidase domain